MQAMDAELTWPKVEDMENTSLYLFLGQLAVVL
jgi:hypothetical protein